MFLPSYIDFWSVVLQL